MEEGWKGERVREGRGTGLRSVPPIQNLPLHHCKYLTY